MKNLNFIIFFCNKRLNAIHRFGRTGENTASLKGSLAWMTKRPSYQPTGTRLSPRSVSVWRLVRSPSSLFWTKRQAPLYALIADGKYRKTSLGREEWKKLITGASLKNNCQKEGFNVLSVNAGASRARIGIVGNNENACTSSDSRIGFGTAGYPDNTNSCGNVAKQGGDNGDKFIKAMGYIFVH